MEEAAKRAALGMIPYGLMVLTASHKDGSNGMAVNWLTQCSFRPPLLAIAVEHDAHTLELIRASGRFVVTLLRPEQKPVATSLSRPWKLVHDKLQQVPLEHTPSGIPLPSGGLAWLECAVRGEHTSGDHVLVIGEVVDAALHEKAGSLTLHAAGLRYGW